MARFTQFLSTTVIVTVVAVLALTIGPLEAAAGPRSGSKKTRPPATSWEFAFRDEFTDARLDSRKWETQFPWGRDRSNVGELQYYAEDAFEVANGKLRIMARENPEGRSHRYDSGLISTHSSFTTEYGRFEISAKLPKGQGLWPAFWLLPVDTSWPPEIDVFEALGHDSDTVHMTAHWSDGGEHRQQGAEFSGPDFSNRFHTFAVEWTPERLTWFVDGIKRHEVVNKSPRQPMYLLANLAVGGNWPGAPDATTAFPAAYEIDYIRAYKAAPAPAVSKSSTPDNGKGDNTRKKRNRHNRRTGK